MVFCKMNTEDIVDFYLRGVKRPINQKLISRLLKLEYELERRKGPKFLSLVMGGRYESRSPKRTI